MSAADLSQVAWPEVEARLAAGALAVLVLGACEQHGAHLPLTTDTDMAQGLARRIAEQLGALLLPPLPYGDAWSARHYPGTLSLSPETLVAVLCDLGRGLQAQGARGLILVNGHFGNRAPMARAVERLVDGGLAVLHLDYPGLPDLTARLCEAPLAGHGFQHADEFETSVMLALRPEAVAMERAEASYPAFPATFGSEPMGLRSFNPSGVFGDPTVATADKGAAFLTGLTEAALAVIAAWRARHGL